MIYKQVSPSLPLSHVIKSFWTVDSENDKSIRREKIIPDGYPEMIFHYKDPYKSNINGKWRDQRDKYLIAGQIRNFFHLENTGYTGIFAIKFQPWALKSLFDIEVRTLTNDAIIIPNKLLNVIRPLKDIAFENISFENKVLKSEKWINNFIKSINVKAHKGERAVHMILDFNGQLGLDDILEKTKLSERSLERYFRKHIGLSPKFYCRVIRFSHIFRLVSCDNPNWSEISLQAGFYDQSHFIKNFKEFTGEEPAKYGFTNNNMAHLFLKS